MKPDRKIHILVIDDEELICWSLKHSFEKLAGYHVHCVHNSNEAIKKLNERRYDIILTDLNLPDVKDFDIVRKIRERASGIPVIVMSAHLSDPFFESVFIEEADTYIHKPFEIDEVLRKVREAVEV